MMICVSSSNNWQLKVFRRLAERFRGVLSTHIIYQDTPLCPPLLGGIVVLRSIILPKQIITEPKLSFHLTTQNYG
jgi:hypothetical protein